MLEVNFTPFPTLESQRLLLRQITPADVDQVYSIRSDAATMKYIPRPLAKNKQDALDHIQAITKGLEESESIAWAITFKDDDRLVGIICLLRMQLKNFRTEMGYVLHPNYHGKGIMDEAVKLVINYAFNVLKFHSIEAVIDPDNLASEKVLLKNNFVKEGHLKENEFYEGRFLDTIIYSLLNNSSGLF